MTSSMTGCTWIFNLFSATMTDITGHLTTHGSKWSLGVHIDYSRTMTTPTGYRTCSRFGTGTCTGSTSCLTVIGNFTFHTKNRFFKFQIDRILQVIPLTRCIRIARRTTSTKEARENVFKATETCSVETTKATCSSAEASIGTSRTILVIGRTF